MSYKNYIEFNNFKSHSSIEVYETTNNSRDLICAKNINSNKIECILFRYIFTENFTDVNLQEIGPRFAMRLLYVQKGLFDPEKGEYEWIYKDKMGVKRRKFYL